MAREYRAFISYSHRDERIARRLHRRIEGYRPPARLAAGAAAPPRRIAPVFRDRDELATSVDLSARIREALEGSENLVVLCSPAAAASRWVNREIEEFAARRGAGAIHAVIVGGKAPEAFPPALLALSAEPLAADLTEAGDGFEDGALKLVAGLLPAPYAEVKNREVARARARAWRNGLLAAAFALVALVALAAGWRAMEETRAREAELTRAEAAILAAVEGIERIVDQVAAGAERGEIPVALAAGLLATAEGVAEGVVALAPDNPRLSRARGDLLIQLSRHHTRAGSLAKATDAAARAEAIFARLATAGDEYAERWRGGALLERGDAALAAGDRTGALASYEEGLAIARNLAARDPGNAQRARDVSVSLERIGDVRRAAGDLSGALAAYEEGLAIRRDLAALDPGDPRGARIVYVSLVKVGDIRRAEGDRAGAQAAYEEGLAIVRALAARDPADAESARDVSASLDRVGNVRRAAGDRAGALEAFEEGLGIARDLAARDPDNAEWARDTAVSLLKLGDIRQAAGDRAGALAAYEEGLAIVRDLAARDPGNAGWARDASICLNKIGDVRLGDGDLAAALAAYEEGLAITRDLAARDPGNADWALGVSVSLDRVGDVRRVEGDRASALAAYEESLAIRRDLAARDPGNAGRARNVSVSLERVGDVRLAAGDAAGALAAYEEGLAIRRDLAARDPGNAGWARDVVVSLAKMAQADEARAVEYWAEAVERLEAMEARRLIAPADDWILPVAREELAKARAR